MVLLKATNTQVHVYVPSYTYICIHMNVRTHIQTHTWNKLADAMEVVWTQEGVKGVPTYSGNKHKSSLSHKSVLYIEPSAGPALQNRLNSNDCGKVRAL